MFENLNSLGITHPEAIDRYSLREEGGVDILKIYFQRNRGEIFAKSIKCKFARDPADSSVFNPKLASIIKELQNVCYSEEQDSDLHAKILNDLRHLEMVVSNKIAEIERDIRRLQHKQ